jgi:serine/threonine-protein kinase RCK2
MQRINILKGKSYTIVTNPDLIAKQRYKLCGGQVTLQLSSCTLSLNHPNTIFSSLNVRMCPLHLCAQRMLTDLVLVMEGGELFHQIVKLTYFSENLARHVILQVAHGIRHLHEERGVVHRDIKPENLLFTAVPIRPSVIPPVQRPYDEEKVDEGEFIPGVGGGGIGRVKIADFGLSKVVWNEQTLTPCGTVGYTAPEIIKDERYSKSVDLWALGCVLYTLLCGFPPFYDESISTLTEKVAKGHYTFLSPWWDDISASCEISVFSPIPGNRRACTFTAKDLIQHLLCVDPDQRYTIDEFLAHPWCNAAPAPPPPPTPFVYAYLPPQARPLDSPLLRGEARNHPGIATLKEAFDITYAVHRMEEEGSRRRGKGAGTFLGGLNEDDEEGSAEATPSQRNPGNRAKDGEREGEFVLDIDSATLLGRRLGGRNRGAGVLHKKSPLTTMTLEQPVAGLKLE